MTKKISFIFITILILLFSGCSQKFTHLDKQESISSLDFTKYQKNNFLITPGEYGGNYTAMGIFTFKIYPEANYIKIKEKNRQTGKWISEYLSSQEVLDLAYETAIKKGANAITHFKMNNTFKDIYDGKQFFTLYGLEMSGLLIKRNK